MLAAPPPAPYVCTTLPVTSYAARKPLRTAAIVQTVFCTVSWIVFYHFWFLPILGMGFGALGIYATMEPVTAFRVKWVRAYFYASLVLAALFAVVVVLFIFWTSWGLLSLLFTGLYLGLSGAVYFIVIKRCRDYLDELTTSPPV